MESLSIFLARYPDLDNNIGYHCLLKAMQHSAEDDTEATIAERALHYYHLKLHELASSYKFPYPPKKDVLEYEVVQDFKERIKS